MALKVYEEIGLGLAIGYTPTHTHIINHFYSPVLVVQ